MIQRQDTSYTLTCSWENIDHSRRDACSCRKLSKFESCEWRHLGRFNDYSISSCKTGSHFPAQHHEWVVPWSHQATHTVQYIEYLQDISTKTCMESFIINIITSHPNICSTKTCMKSFTINIIISYPNICSNLSLTKRF